MREDELNVTLSQAEIGTSAPQDQSQLVAIRGSAQRSSNCDVTVRSEVKLLKPIKTVGLAGN